MAIRSRFPDAVEAVVRPVGRAMARTGISANALTTGGLLLTAGATWAVANDQPMLAAGLLITGGLADLLDGAVARANHRPTPFGGFYDSVSDRISDGMILGGIAWWLSDEPRLFMLTIVALVAAQVTSYVRARAEAIDLTCTIGIFERAERAVLLMVGLLFHPWLLEPVLWVLAVGSTVTVVQRIHHVWCQINRDIPDELLALAMADRAWSRAFTAAARRFYGERNFDGAVDRGAEAALGEQDGGVASGHDGPGPRTPGEADGNREPRHGGTAELHEGASEGRDDAEASDEEAGSPRRAAGRAGGPSRARRRR